MKIAAPFLVLSALAAVHAQVPSPSPARSVPPAVPSPVVRPLMPPLPAPVRAGLPPAPSAGEDVLITVLPTLDLDFPGGSPTELVEAMSKAAGRQINVIISPVYNKVQLPPVKVRGVTVASIFAAISAASAHQAYVPAGNGNFQIMNVSSVFTPVSGGGKSDDGVWAFSTTELDMEQRQALEEKPKIELRHFQLKNYLAVLKVEDITTAIRTGWDMLGIKKEKQPELKFHEETGVLFAVGDPAYLAQIPQLLQQLPPNEPETGAPHLPAAIPRPGGALRSTSPTR